MSSFAADPRLTDDFSSALLRAGAVFSAQDGRSVAVNYGSAAAELAVCVSAVGLVDRSELTQLVVQAPAAQLGHLVARLAGNPLAVGGAVQTAGAWWCRSADDTVVALCEPRAGLAIRDQLRSHVVHHVALTVCDRSEEWAAIALLGRATRSVLGAVGAYGTSGDPRGVTPFTAGTVDGVEVTWLLESDHRALALVPRRHAAAVWLALESAGRPFGLSCAGREAAARYRLLELGRASARA